MKHLSNVNHMLFSALLMSIIASGFGISVMEFISSNQYTESHPLIVYINTSGWAFWQATVVLFMLTIKNHLPAVFDNKLVLCYNVLLAIVLISDLNYILT